MHYDSDSFTQSENDQSTYNSTTNKEIISYNTYETNKLTPTVHGIFTLLGLTFNFMTILVIVRGQQFAKRVKIQLTNLAVADFLSSFFIHLANGNIEFVTMTFPNNAALCKISMYIGGAILYASLLCHVSIALERFVAVYFPFRMVKYTQKKVIRVYVAIWIMAFVSNVEYIFVTDIYPNPVKPNKFVCFKDYYAPLAAKLAPYFGIKVITPSVVIFLTYLCIAVKLRMRRRAGSTNQSGTIATNNQVMVMLAADGIFAVLIWMPHFVFTALSSSELIKPDNSPLISEILLYVILINTFITPIIYFIFSKDYRMDIADILCSSCCRRRQRSKRKVPPIVPIPNMYPLDAVEANNCDNNIIGDKCVSIFHTPNVIETPESVQTTSAEHTIYPSV